MRHIEHERSDVRGGDGVHRAGRAVDSKAGRPVLTLIVVERGVPQFEGVARTIVGCHPFPAIGAKGIALAQGELALFGIGDEIDAVASGVFEFNVFAGVAQSPLPATDHIRDSRIGCVKCCHVSGDNEVAAGGEGGGGEGVVRATAKLPASEVHGLAAAMVKLDPFLIVALSHGMIHDLVDHDLPLEDRRRVQRVIPRTAHEEIPCVGKIPNIRTRRPRHAHVPVGGVSERELEGTRTTAGDAGGWKVVDAQIRSVHAADCFAELNGNARQ